MHLYLTHNVHNVVLFLYRSMLKEIYDLLLSEKETEDMKKFELASHTFGTANLMSHLTLFDRFFEDYQTNLTKTKPKKK